MKKLIVLIGALLIVGCATTEQIQKSSEGTTFKVEAEKSKVIEVIVAILMEDGYTVNNINEKFGIISTAPNKMPSGQIMKKLGEPGADFVSSSFLGISPPMSTVEITVNVSSGNTIRFKASVYDLKKNSFSGADEQNIVYQRSAQLTDYYANLIKERLNE